MIAAGVLGLLTLFLGLQYRWLTEVSEAERERMQKRVETDTARLAEDFNREMQAAYYNFQTDADTWKAGDWTEFNERYDYWRSRTNYPGLIRGIYFFEASADARVLRYEPENRRFIDAGAPTPHLDQIRARIGSDPAFKPVAEDLDAMVLPIYQHERRIDHIVLRQAAGSETPVVRLPERFGSLVVMLDRDVITQNLLPDLVAKYFPAGDYRVEVIDRNKQPVFATGTFAENTDANAALFNLSPDNLLFFANREIIPGSGDRKDVVVNQRVESHTFTARTQAPNEKAETFKVEVHGPMGEGRPRTAMIAGTSDGTEPWTVRVQHSAGSIAAYVKGERNKSFVVGLGIYLLLIAGIAAILLSAIRSKRFAQRQIDFVSSVSHEFRTPLAVIYSAGENLADGVAKDDAQVSKYGQLIKGEGKKLSGMVEQILEFAGAASGRRNYNFEPTEISVLVEQALAQCGPLIEANGFSVEKDLASDLPKVSADRAALLNALQNLIANSVKYSDGSKWIRVSATNGSGTVKISVEDRGIGVAPDELRHIFEPFYRGKEVVDAQISGNGLGLNLVKRIVEAHGGKISATSKPGRGSTFTIELPQE